MIFSFTKRTVWDVMRMTQAPCSYGRLLHCTPGIPITGSGDAHLLVRWS
jgi:hypothetical protein